MSLEDTHVMRKLASRVSSFFEWKKYGIDFSIWSWYWKKKQWLEFKVLSCSKRFNSWDKLCVLNSLTQHWFQHRLNFSSLWCQGNISHQSLAQRRLLGYAERHKHLHCVFKPSKLKERRDWKMKSLISSIIICLEASMAHDYHSQRQLLFSDVYIHSDDQFWKVYLSVLQIEYKEPFISYNNCGKLSACLSRSWELQSETGIEKQLSFYI